MNAVFKRLLRKRSWDESRVSYRVTKSEKLIRKTLTMSAKDQQPEQAAAVQYDKFYEYWFPRQGEGRFRTIRAMQARRIQTMTSDPKG